MIKKCLQCGNNFKIKKNNFAKFCSKFCAGKNYREKNKDKAKKARAKYYFENKEKEKKKCKEWYNAHRESEIEKNKEYRKQNRELFNWYHNKNRFSGIKEMILVRDGKKCRICENINDLCVHHKDNSGKTDDINNDIKNLITLCRKCHTTLHHWQRKNHILQEDEDIVRTIKKLIEANDKN